METLNYVEQVDQKLQELQMENLILKGTRGNLSPPRKNGSIKNLEKSRSRVSKMSPSRFWTLWKLLTSFINLYDSKLFHSIEFNLIFLFIIDQKYEITILDIKWINFKEDHRWNPKRTTKIKHKILMWLNKQLKNNPN